MKSLGKNWFKIGVMIVLVGLMYTLWFSFVQIPKERAAAKYLADLTLQKCLTDVNEVESRINTNNPTYQSEEKSVQQMRVDCKNNYQSHVDQWYSQL